MTLSFGQRRERALKCPYGVRTEAMRTNSKVTATSEDRRTGDDEDV
jgi:hypothetical protein